MKRNHTMEGMYLEGTKKQRKRVVFILAEYDIPFKLRMLFDHSALVISIKELYRSEAEDLLNKFKEVINE